MPFPFVEPKSLILCLFVPMLSTLKKRCHLLEFKHQEVIADPPQLLFSYLLFFSQDQASTLQSHRGGTTAVLCSTVWELVWHVHCSVWTALFLKNGLTVYSVLWLSEYNGLLIFVQSQNDTKWVNLFSPSVSVLSLSETGEN